MSLYKNSEVKSIALKSYDRGVKFWPVDYEEAWVDTDYGKSHIIVSSHEHAKPVFLLPGLFADATMWYANIVALADHYRIYCLDGGFNDTKSDIWLEHMLDVIEYGSVDIFDLPRHLIYHANELTMVDMPVLVVAGGKPIIYKDPQAFATAVSKAYHMQRSKS